MNIFLMVLKYLPSLVSLAEGIFSWKKKSGALKKSFVKGTLKTIFTGVAAESTGGQKTTWDALETSVDMLIDSTVKIANAAGAFDEPTGVDAYTAGL